jgi:hypothetical protein
MTEETRLVGGKRSGNKSKGIRATTIWPGGVWGVRYKDQCQQSNTEK